MSEKKNNSFKNRRSIRIIQLTFILFIFIFLFYLFYFYNEKIPAYSGNNTHLIDPINHYKESSLKNSIRKLYIEPFDLNSLELCFENKGHLTSGIVSWNISKISSGDLIVETKNCTGNFNLDNIPEYNLNIIVYSNENGKLYTGIEGYYQLKLWDKIFSAFISTMGLIASLILIYEFYKMINYYS